MYQVLHRPRRALGLWVYLLTRTRRSRMVPSIVAVRFTAILLVIRCTGTNAYRYRERQGSKNRTRRELFPARWPDRSSRVRVMLRACCIPYRVRKLQAGIGICIEIRVRTRACAERMTTSC